MTDQSHGPDITRHRVVIATVILVVIAIGVAAWYVFLVIEPFKPPGIATGSIDEGKPWNDRQSGEPFEGARLIAQYHDEYRIDDGQPTSHTWLYQVLIVFPQESRAEYRGGGCGSFGTTPDHKSHGLRPHWRYRFDGGEDQTTSITLLSKEIEDEKWMHIEDRRFQLRQGNLFCVFVDEEMQFDRVVQLNETITRKATIADFKRLLPNNSAVQAIRIDRGNLEGIRVLGGHSSSSPEGRWSTTLPYLQTSYANDVEPSTCNASKT